jgi:hypothetical protein
MSDLDKHFERLLGFAKQWGIPSSWSRVLFVEDESIEHGMPSRIPRSSLVAMEEYAHKFEAHLNAGHEWINMRAAGILDDSLLVIIELPNYKNTVPRDYVSVNFSGPYFLNGNPNWNGSDRYIIVD